MEPVPMLKTAAIMASGHGSRFFPVTKSINKAMLPVGSKPVVEYIVEQCLEAGVERIIFHISSDDETLKHYYSPADDLIERMRIQGVSEQRLDKISSLHNRAKFEFVRTKDTTRYGTAMPLHELRSALQGESQFLLLNSDGFVWGEPNPTSQLIDAFTAGLAAVIGVTEVPAEAIGQYGGIEMEGAKLVSILEKPAPEEVSSNLANLGMYGLSQKVFEFVDELLAHQQSGEYRITDVINAMAKELPVAVEVLDGKYLDCGNPQGLLEAWNELAG